MKEQFSNRTQFLNWIKGAGSVAILSISLLGGVQEVTYQATSLRVLSEISESQPDYFQEGEYVVEYEHDSNNDNVEELVYKYIATAFSFKGRLAQHPEIIIGGMDQLLEALSGYEYIEKIHPENSGLLGHFLIVIPESPEEIEALKRAVEEYSIAYIFPDGSGTINRTNLQMGCGFQV